ncbi:PucR family transcriptional regulator [Sediminibacillus massiliensis]|uniref:PucR family transcriptional regulator n=1 Tax=Sediminibacillus massiliensis TaxID=1926277 RepID=UPI0009885181|nr:PucR family transcriptional regulator [Sediminibacillus massiliensis]
MGLTAMDVMQLPIMETSKVKAGGNLLKETPVEWISVIEGPVENFVRKHEFVLSTGIGCEDDPVQLERFVEDVIQSGASVLAIATGRFIFNIPDRITELAVNNRFILLEVPWEVRFGDIIQGVLQEINEDKHVQRQQAEGVRQELTNCVLEDRGLQAITKLIYKHTQIPVGIADQSKYIRANQSLSKKMVDILAREQPGNMEAASETGVPFLDHPLYHYMKECAVDGQKCYVLTIQNNNKPQGYIIVQPEIPTQLTWFVMNVLEHALTACALYFAKENAVEMAEIRLKDNFVLNLAKEKHINSQKLAKAQLLGYDLSLPYICLVGKLTLKHSVSISNDNPVNSSMQSVNYYFQKEITNAGNVLHRRTMATFEEGRVIIFLEAEQVSCAEIASQFMDIIERRLYELLGGVEISWGVSKHGDGLYAFYESCQEASTALDIGEKQNGPGERTFFTDTRINRLLMAVSSEKVILDIVKDTLDPLVEYDKKRHTDLIYTFLTYNKHKGNVSQTARALNLHRQSLLHRLRNIESLTQLSLVDSDDIFLLELSIRLWMLNKII